MGKIRSRVEACCFTTPLSRVITVTGGPPAGSISSETMGPTGQKVSKPLPRVHWPSAFWMSRAVTSLTQT